MTVALHEILKLGGLKQTNWMGYKTLVNWGNFDDLRETIANEVGVVHKEVNQTTVPLHLYSQIPFLFIKALPALITS